MIKSLLFSALLVGGLNVNAQNFTNALHLQYHNNSFITPTKDNNLIFTGSHFQFNNITYLINKPPFSVGLGFGLTTTYAKFKDFRLKESHVPLSIVQKIHLPALNPILDYVRFGASINCMLTSSYSMNGGDKFYKITSGITKNPVAAEAFLGWNLGKKGFIETGYVFKQISNEILYDYGRHNVSIGVGIMLGETGRSTEKPFKKQQ